MLLFQIIYNYCGNFAQEFGETYEYTQRREQMDKRKAQNYSAEFVQKVPQRYKTSIEVSP